MSKTAGATGTTNPKGESTRAKGKHDASSQTHAICDFCAARAQEKPAYLTATQEHATHEHNFCICRFAPVRGVITACIGAFYRSLCGKIKRTPAISESPSRYFPTSPALPWTLSPNQRKRPNCEEKRQIMQWGRGVLDVQPPTRARPLLNFKEHILRHWIVMQLQNIQRKFQIFV